MCTIPTAPFNLTGELFVETLIFTNPSFLLKNIKKENRILANHMDFIFKAGERLPVIPFCPFCHEYKVTNFVWSNNPHYDLMSCDSCVGKLESKANMDNSVVLPIKLSTINMFQDEEQKKIGVFFKNLVGISNYAAPNEILNMFISCYSKKIHNN